MRDKNPGAPASGCPELRPVYFETTKMQFEAKRFGQSGARKRRESPYASAIYQIASYLDLHSAEQPDMEALARAHGMSYRNFLRYWKQQFRIPPGVYLRRKQLDEACRLLEETNLKIYEVAARAGFADPYYFIRAFHREKQLTPGAYRAMQRNASASSAH